LSKVLMLERASVKPAVVVVQPKKPTRWRRIAVDGPELIATK
jgi:hypothetical protein